MKQQKKVAKAKPRTGQKNSSLAARIVAGYLVLVAIMAGIGAYTYVGMQRVMAEYRLIVDEDHPYLLAIKEINTEVTAQLAAQRAFLLTGDAQYALRAELDGNKVKQAINKAMELAKEKEEKNLLNQVENIHGSLNDVQAEVFEIYNQGAQNQAVQIALVDLDATQKRLGANFNILQGINERRVDEARQNANTAAKKALMVTLVLVALGTAIGIILGTILAKQSVRSLKGLATAADRISAGDLTTQVQAKGRDEVAHLARSFQVMVGELGKIIAGVRESVLTVTHHAEQLSTSAEETTRATEQIASSIQEVAEGAGQQVQETADMAAVVEQMAAAMDQIANNAQLVALSSQESAVLAEQGSVAIKDVIAQNNVVSQSMVRLSQLITELGQRSAEIGQIVEVITGIADQTNLLALNAAIEAARAGEQGKGFAVVADEVRKLAEQAAQAAKQIALLVDRTQHDTERAIETMKAGSTEVASGSQLLESAQAILEKIFAAVGQVAEQIQEVSAASEEMAANTDRVVGGAKNISVIAESTSAGTENIAAATQEQTATMEEIAAAAQMLTELAYNLEQAVARFKLA
ncbi:MAG TPA: HAMP domain-containing protein [Firmicutes bacterium]|nr:HAMP domain-containing protein [Bacillota bacterium]